MSDFTPITTQEAFDEAVRVRIERAQKAVREEFGDYETIKNQNADYLKQIETFKAEKSTFQQNIADLTEKIKGYENDSVKTEKALEYGLPYEFRTRLKGETAEEIEADAKALAQLIGKQNPRPLPMRKNEPGGDGGDNKESAFREMLEKMKGE